MSIPLIILASIRRDSNTEKPVKEIYGDNPYHLINLLDYKIPFKLTALYFHMVFKGCTYKAFQE